MIEKEQTVDHYLKAIKDTFIEKALKAGFTQAQAEFLYHEKRDSPF